MASKQEPINQLDDTEARWFAVYTRFKCEKVVCKRLQSKEIETYLPLQRVTRYYTRKIVHRDLPLISCYVFTRITRKEYVPVLEDQDVLHFVKLKSDLIAIPEREINILKAITGEGILVEVGPIQEKPEAGDEVEITQGRLLGLRGILVEHQNNRRVVIELENLGISLRLQLELDQVQKVRSGKKAPESKKTGDKNQKPRDSREPFTRF